MQVGDTIQFKLYGFITTGIIVDDCFRKTEDRCTMLVKLTNHPETELEINLEDVQPMDKGFSDE
jgi:hypothetical protein